MMNKKLNKSFFHSFIQYLAKWLGSTESDDVETPRDTQERSSTLALCRLRQLLH